MFGGRKNLNYSDDDSSDDEDYKPSHRYSLKPSHKIGRGQRRISYEVFELEDKVTGKVLDFNIYNDSDLPFLNS
jgi:hypothetical protein